MTKQIHIINPLLNLNGGSERRSIALAELLSRSPKVKEVTIWHQRETDPESTGKSNKIKARRSDIVNREQLLDGSHIVHVGFYHQPPHWMLSARPSRLTLIANADPRHFTFARTIALLSQIECKLEFCYASQWIKELVGVAGEVQISPISTHYFKPHDNVHDRVFTVGRISRDATGKHHPDDLSFYHKLTSEGLRIRILGGTILTNSISDTTRFTNSRIEILPEGAQPANEFLHSLDCFYYRTHPNWIEPHGRVITEAMSCGIPVIAHRRGGYAEFIRHGVNGFLFETADEAETLIKKLSKDTSLCTYIGKNARRAMIEMFSDASMLSTCAYYERNKE